MQVNKAWFINYPAHNNSQVAKSNVNALRALPNDAFVKSPIFFGSELHSDNKQIKTIDLNNPPVIKDAPLPDYNKERKEYLKDYYSMAGRFTVVVLEDIHALLKEFAHVTYDTPGLNLLRDYSKQPYDLAHSFAIVANNTAQEKGSALIVHGVPKVFKGIEPEIIAEKLDILPCFLDPLCINEFSISGKKFSAEQVGAGDYGRVYKISDEDGNCAVIKVYHNPNEVDGGGRGHGSYGEIALANELQKAGVIDVPEMYMANSIGKYVNVDNEGKKVCGAWILSEYITEETPLKAGNKTFQDWLKDYNLSIGDIGGVVGKYQVDLGGQKCKNIRGFDFHQMGRKWLTYGYQNGETTEQMIETLEDYMKTGEKPKL